MSMPPVPEPTALLFTYGTLLPAFSNPYARYLQAHSTALGPGWFPGQLYDLGPYPGAVFDPEAGTKVHGGIFRLHRPQAALAVLDAYEGVDDPHPQYARKLLEVMTEAGPVTCWGYVYLHLHLTQNLKPIPFGDYVKQAAGELRGGAGPGGPV